MKKLFKVLKVILISVIGLIALVVLGLLLYYQSLYKPTPQPQAAALNLIPKDTSENVLLLPVPKKATWTTGSFSLKAAVTFNAPIDDGAAIKKYIEQQLAVKATQSSNGSLSFIKRNDLGNQEYKLSIKPAKIIIEYSSLNGLFYGLTTISQLALQTNNQLPCVEIHDKPDLEVRGVMLDISRDKVPTLETLYGIVDYLTILKYNHLQLYIEGFSFAYPSFKDLWEKTETPLTGEEIGKLDAYCRDRFIDLVPNQSSLGHMNAWLETDQFKDLAECPEGYKLLGLINVKGTMDASDPRSIELVKKMSEDLLPHFTSENFNINLDEPFELGHCKTKELADKEGVGKVYMDYASKMNDYVKSKGKKTMMWGDVVTKHPDIIPQIPKDITLLEWGYEANHPFKKNCQAYHDAGLRFMVCPGTSSWTSLAGRTENMMGNISNAVENALAFKAAGMLITDWGDLGHWQTLPVSYAGFAYGSALSWNYSSKDQVPLSRFLSRIAFRDETGLMGDFVLNMGRYNQYEEIQMINMTTTNLAYQFGILDKVILDAISKKIQSGITEFVQPGDTAMLNSMLKRFNTVGVYNYKAIIEYTNTLERDLVKAKMNRPDSTTIKDEYRNAIRMIHLGAKLKQYINYHLDQSDEENKALLTEMKALCATVISEYERVWLLRNKRSRIDRSMKSLFSLQQQIDDEIAALEKGGVSKFFKRTTEKLISAGAAIYLR